MTKKTHKIIIDIVPTASDEGYHISIVHEVWLGADKLDTYRFECDAEDADEAFGHAQEFFDNEVDR